MAVGKALQCGAGLVGPRADRGKHPPILEPRQLPIRPLTESSRFIPLPRWCVAAFHLKTGFERQLFETRGAKASWASQSKQAFGKFREKQTRLNFPSDSPGETFRLLGGGGTGELGSYGRLRGQESWRKTPETSSSFPMAPGSTVGSGPDRPRLRSPSFNLTSFP